MVLLAKEEDERKLGTQNDVASFRNFWDAMRGGKVVLTESHI